MIVNEFGQFCFLVCLYKPEFIGMKTCLIAFIEWANFVNIDLIFKKWQKLLKLNFYYFERQTRYILLTMNVKFQLILLFI